MTETQAKGSDWAIKYRPRSYQDCIGNRQIFDKLQKNVEEGFMPGLLLVGPPGIGKSTVAIIERGRLKHPETNYTKFNASDKGTIKVVREEVLSLCRKPTLGGERRIIHFEELDSPRTRAAQEALRDPFEMFKDLVEFIVTGNSEGGIIDPLKSRLATYRFGLVTIPEIVSYVNRIVAAEHVVVDDPSLLEKVAMLAKGRLRDSATILQTNVSRGHLSTVMEAPDATEDVKNIYKKFLGYERKEDGELDYEGGLNLSEKIIERGTSERDLVFFFNAVSRKSESFPPMLKAHVSRMCGEYDYRMSQSATQELQRHAFLGALFVFLQQAMKQQEKAK